MRSSKPSNQYIILQCTKGRTSVTGFDSNLLNWFSVIYLVFKAFSVRMHRVVHSNIFTLLHFKTCLGNSHIKSFLTDVTNCLPLMDLYIQYCFKTQSTTSAFKLLG